MTYGIHVASNGNGEFYDRLGRVTPPKVSMNYTLPTTAARVGCFHPPCKKHPPAPVPITVATVDLDQSLIFYGGPGAKRDAIEAFLATSLAKHGVAKTYDDTVSKLALISCVDGGQARGAGQQRPGSCSARAALKGAGIETRREEQNRNRLSNNRMRPRDVP
jgi:hypothetical protein